MPEDLQLFVERRPVVDEGEGFVIALVPRLAERKVAGAGDRAAHPDVPANVERVLARTTSEDRKLAQELEEAPFDHLKQILQILLPAETALLGSATGFYFGARS